MNTPIKAVLLSQDEKNYSIVKNLFTTIDNNRFELEWIVLEQTQIRQVISQNYQVYLIDAHLWINPSQEQAQNLATLQKYLSPLINQISPTPIILLTDNSFLGKATLELGIEDYWDKNELTPSIIERSLRLTLKNTQQNGHQERVLEENKLKQKIRQLEEYKNKYEAGIEAREEIFMNGTLKLIKYFGEEISKKI